MEELDLFGQWWFPNEGRIELSAPPDGAGRLTYTDDQGIIAEIQFRAVRLEDALRSRDHDLVVGLTGAGRWVSLVNCAEFHRNSMLGSDLVAVRLRASVAYLDVAFETIEEIRFVGATFIYSVLDQWATRQGFSREFGDGLRAAQVTYTRPPDRVASLPSGQVTLGESFEVRGDDLTAVLARRSAFRVVPAESSTLDQLLSEFNSPLHALLTVASRGPVELDQLQLSFRFPATGDQPPRTTGIPTWIDPVFRHPNSKRGRFKFLFDESQIDFETFVPAWFGLYRAFEAVIQLYVAAHGAQRSFVEQRFQYAVAAAEGLHRELNPPSPTEIAAHTAQVDAILESCPERFRAWLHAQIGEYYGIPLWRRLKDLLLPHAMFETFLERRRAYVILKRLVDARNYLFHGKNTGRDERLNGTQLYWSSELLLFGIEWTMLARLEQSETIARWFSDYQGFAFAAREFRRTMVR